MSAGRIATPAVNAPSRASATTRPATRTAQSETPASSRSSSVPRAARVRCAARTSDPESGRRRELANPRRSMAASTHPRDRSTRRHLLHLGGHPDEQPPATQRRRWASSSTPTADA